MGETVRFGVSLDADLLTKFDALCERQGCLARAEPPVTRPLGLDEMVTGLSAFDFQ